MVRQTTERTMDGASMSERMGGPQMMEHMMDGGMMDGAAGGGLWTIVPLLLFALVVALVVVAVVALVGGVRRGGSAPGRDETAREVLDRRYADDQLSREEYLRRREDLQGPEPGPGLPR